MVRLDSLFKMVNGVVATSLSIQDIKEKNMISFRRPSKTFKGTQAGYIKREDVDGSKIFPKDTLMVSTDGEGSHTYSYVVNCEFVPNSNVCALVPLINMTLREKFFYAKCITMNRPLFSYGRKPKGERLAKIMVPSKEEIPSWVYTMDIKDYSDIAEPKVLEKASLPPINEWKSFEYEELFTIAKAKGPTATQVKKSPGSSPYVTASMENNGITGYGDFTPSHNGNCLTVGHLGDVFYQPNDFSGNNVTVCVPKFEGMNVQVGLFLSSLMNKNKFKYNYGRVVGITRLKIERISVPVNKEGNIDVELITKYINSLSYSKYL